MKRLAIFHFSIFVAVVVIPFVLFLMGGIHFPNLFRARDTPVPCFGQCTMSRRLCIHI